jgi:tRNA-2-methylthio-N6-dimethylallyladenosine synthase
LADIGYQATAEEADSDVIILNTCHIREKAAEKVYSELGRLKALRARKQQQGSDLMIGVAGCVAQAEGKLMRTRASQIDFIVGPQAYHRLPDLIKQAKRSPQMSVAKGSGVVDTDFPAESKFDYIPETISPQKPGSAFITIQEGCDKFCTFCVVPYTRGAEYSRPVAAILEEARRAADQGIVEVTLLGQNVNAYHGANGGAGIASLADLIIKVAAISGIERVRYTTSHPRDMADDLIHAHGEVDELMPYLHLPVQSGSDYILRAMNRRHTAEQYLEIIHKLRQHCPDIALSSDFIVGYPGEREEDFQQTLALIMEVGFAQAYSFAYSERAGTPASNSADLLDGDVKKQRLQKLQKLLNQQQLHAHQQQVGKVMPVLLESKAKKAGQTMGRNPHMQACVLANPDNLDNADHDLANRLGSIINVRVNEAYDNCLLCEMV